MKINIIILVYFITFRFNRSSERQYSLRAPDALNDPIVMVELDTSNGVMFPLYDPDTNLVFLCGKGDSVIRYFEVCILWHLAVRADLNHSFYFEIHFSQVTPEAPFVHFISTFQSSDPQRGIGMMPKRGCDVNTCEIAKFYRLTNNGLCQVISFTVPRRSELFQEDLYPDTLSDEPPNTAEEWVEGTDAEPILVSLKVSVDCSLGCEKFRHGWHIVSTLCCVNVVRVPPSRFALSIWYDIWFFFTVTYLLQLKIQISNSRQETKQKNHSKRSDCLD